jgi:hypothetical protein
MTALNLSAIDARWLHIADAAAQSGIDMRYSTPKSLATSYWCKWGSSTFVHFHRSPSPGSAQVRATLTPHESGCRAEKERTMAYMIVNSDDDDSWAHKDCVLEHVCWTIPDFTAASAPW